MSFISDDDINKVREATDLVALVSERSRMTQKGREFWCCCPLHGEKTPSFKIDPATQLWHCFGCGEGGDAFGFIMKADDLTFPESVRKLAERAHIEIEDSNERGISKSEKQRLKEVCKSAADFYHLQLMRSKSNESNDARQYLASRGLGGDIPKIWNLGFAAGGNTLVNHLRQCGFKTEEMIAANVAVKNRSGLVRDRFFNRVMFPINDISGECIAFGGRVIGSGEPKYLNSQETPIFHKSQVLYGLDKAKAKMASSGVAIVAEGYTDVISLHKAGITNSVATLGTALTRNHIRQLSRQAGKRIVYLFDGDQAGQRATDRALQFIDHDMTPEAGKSKIELCALCLPDNMDPAEYLDTHSASQMQELIDSATPLLKFGIERRLAQSDLSNAEGRAKALAEALAVLAPIKSSILAKEYAVGIASRLGLREEDVLYELSKIVVPQNNVSNDAIQSHSSNKQSLTSYQDRTRISKEESNRLSLESELLGICINEPMLALQHADLISDIEWQGSGHSKIANAIFSTLAEDVLASPAKLLDAASVDVENASSILTRASTHEGYDVENVIRFISEELHIGDLEREVANMKILLSSDDGSNDDTLFESLVSIQSKLAKARDEHIAL